MTVHSLCDYGWYSTNKGETWCSILFIGDENLYEFEAKIRMPAMFLLSVPTGSNTSQPWIYMFASKNDDRYTRSVYYDNSSVSWTMPDGKEHLWTIIMTQTQYLIYVDGIIAVDKSGDYSTDIYQYVEVPVYLSNPWISPANVTIRDFCIVSNVTTNPPTSTPTQSPTFLPSDDPSKAPSISPTYEPTMEPTYIPSEPPTQITKSPSFVPTMETISPTMSPTKAQGAVDEEFPSPVNNTIKTVSGNGASQENTGNINTEIYWIVGILALIIIIIICLFVACKIKKRISEDTVAAESADVMKIKSVSQHKQIELMEGKMDITTDRLQSVESIDQRKEDDLTGSSQLLEISGDDIVTAGGNRNSIATQIVAHLAQNSVVADIASDDEIAGDDEIATKGDIQLMGDEIEIDTDTAEGTSEDIEIMDDIMSDDDHEIITQGQL